MKQILFAILLLCVAASASAVPLVSNHTTGQTGEDSIVFMIHNLDSISQPRSNPDSLKVLVIGPSGDSVFAEIILGVTGRLFMKSTGSTAYDSTYFYKAQVSDIDGAGTAGVYTIRFTTVSNQSGGWLRFQKSEQFQVAGTRYSSLASATTLDSQEVYEASYAANHQWSVDSTIRSDTLITQLLDSLSLRGAGIFASAWWDSIVIAVENAVWDATMNDHITTGTTGDYLEFAGNSDNYPSLTEARDSLWLLTGTRALSGAQAWNLTGNITGNVTGNLSGSVGSVTGAVGSVTGDVGGDVGGNVVGFIGGIVSDVAEQIADVTQDSVGSLRGGASSTSLNEILNPYFNLNDTVSFIGTTSTLPIGTISGWYGTIYSTGTGTDNRVSVEYNDVYTAESTVTGGRRVEFTIQRTHTAGQQDSIVLYSNEIKLFPGVYKYGVRGRATTSITQFDAGVVDLYNVSAGAVIQSFNMTQPYSLPSSVGTWPVEADQYIATDTMTVRLRIRLYESRLSGNPAKIYHMSSAFVTSMGANLFAMPAATARAIAGSVGDSLQKPQQVAVDLDEGALVDSIFEELVAGHLSAGSFGALAYRIDSVARAIKDTLSDGVYGPKVNVLALNSDSTTPKALNYAFDTTDAGKSSLTLQEVSYGPARSLHNVVSISQTAGNLPAVSIGQGDGSAAAVFISGGGNAIELEGGGTAGSGLVVAGSGGADDVQGVFFDSGAISIGDINLTLSGSGDNLIDIRTRDTSGTDNYVMDVDITVRPVGSSTTEAFLRTNDSGLAHFTLPNGTFQVLLRRPGYQFLPDTITVNGNASMTIDGYNISNANVATVYGCVRDLGMTTGRAWVGISMPEKKRNGCDSTLLLSNVIKEVLTDSVGCFSFDNVPWSSCFGGSKYKLSVKPATTTAMNLFTPGQAPRDFPVSVPDSISYQVTF